MKRILLFLCLPLFFSACDSDGTSECDDVADADCALPPSAVFVGNQGNFSAGDGSVTVYDPQRGEAAEPITGLASIVQSVTVLQSRLYVTANTGGRVEVYDVAATGPERVGRIEVTNPRYVALDGDRGRLYVSKQLYDRPSEVAVVDAQSLEVVGTVEVGGLAEGVAVAGDRVFVATGAFSATQEVVVIDVEMNEVVQRIDVGCTTPRSLLRDPFNPTTEVWVFCAGSPATDDVPEVEGEVVVLDARSGDVVTRIAVDGGIDTAGPGQDAFARGISIFVVRDQDTVLHFDAETNALVETIPMPGDPIGAVAFEGNQLYLARVPGFDVTGSVTIHEPDGTQVGQFAAGAAPTSIAVLR